MEYLLKIDSRHSEWNLKTKDKSNRDINYNKTRVLDLNWNRIRTKIRQASHEKSSTIEQDINTLQEHSFQPKLVSNKFFVKNQAVLKNPKLHEMK